MKSKERPWVLTKEGPIDEIKKDVEGPKSQKEGKKKEIIIIIIKKKEEDLGLVRGQAARISVRPEDEHQGSRTLMCPFEGLRRGHWLTNGKTKMYVHIFSKKTVENPTNQVLSL